MRIGRVTVDAHLRVEVVDADHVQWPAVRRQMERAGRTDRLLTVSPGGRLSARQTVVAAFLDGRAVAHAVFSVEPARTPAGRAVVARIDSCGIDCPFAGTAVERTMMALAECRAHLMGCHGFVHPLPHGWLAVAA